MLKKYWFLFSAGLILSVIFLSGGGCSNPFSAKDRDPPFDPFEMPEFEIEDGRPKLVIDCATVEQFNMYPVHGFGLVVDLPGTGGEDIQSLAYQMVSEDMNRRRVPNVRATLADPGTAVVEVTALMRPGIQRGDLFDVRVSLPENSSTRSLKGGRLMETDLAEKGFFDALRVGETIARAAGPIMVDDVLATEVSNPESLKRGIILSGGVTQKPRALSLLMKKGSESLIMTDRIAKAINHRFPLPTGLQRGVATAHTSSLIIVEIHPSYVQDVPRYVRVIQSIACFETSAQQARRIERLREELLDPETSQHAAFQLEAIGRAGIPPLQQALQIPDIGVRFHAATSLAYLGDGTSAKMLAEIARSEPAFRVFALNALGVMRNALEAEFYLQELLHVPCAETRYGAFRALKNRNPMDQTIRGEILGGRWGQFSYHGVNSPTPPMVHITAQRYSEIVLFGTDIFLKQPFTLDAGPLIFVNGQIPNTVAVIKFATSGVDERRTVSNRLDEIIRAIADMGGTYPDVVQFLRQADRMGVLSCPLEIDRLPEPNRPYRRSGSVETDWENDIEGEEEMPQSFWERLNPRNIFTPNPGERSSDFRGPVNASSRD